MDPYDDIYTMRIEASADREACMQPEALVKRAIESVRRHKPTGPGRRQKPYPLWVRVKGIFCHGSGYSDSICRRYGFDPNETWVGEGVLESLPEGSKDDR